MSSLATPPFPPPQHQQATRLCSYCNTTLVVPTTLHSAEDVASRIRANYIPVGPESQQIGEFLLKAQESLEYHNAEIWRHRATIMKLEAQYKALQSLVDGYRCLQSPIRKLPSELLHHIFQCVDWSSPDSSSTKNPIQEPIGLSPLNLGRVCTRWRHIVLSSPQLWTYIPVTLDDPESIWGKDPSSVAGTLQTYLQRSGELPLSLRVDILRPAKKAPDLESELLEPSYHDFDAYYPDHPSLRVLARHSRRWRHAELLLGGAYFLNTTALAPIRGNLPILESLRLEYGLPMDSNLFELCPKLQRLDFQPEDGEVPVFPWNQLNVISASSWWLYSNSLRDILNVCPRLIELHMDIDALQNVPYSNASSNLETLSISISDYMLEGCLNSFLDSLTLPRLRSLKISTSDSTEEGYSYADWPHAEFVSFLVRSSCPLETLCIEGFTEEDSGDLTQVLELVPKLRSLRSDNYEVTGAVLDALTITPSESDSSMVHRLPSLPQLTHVELPFKYWYDYVFDMVESRWLPYSGNGGEVARLMRVSNFRDRVTRWTMEPTTLEELRAIRSNPRSLQLQFSASLDSS